MPALARLPFASLGLWEWCGAVCIMHAWAGAVAVCLPQSAQLIWCGQGVKGGGELGENLAGYLQIKQGTPREEGKERDSKENRQHNIFIYLELANDFCGGEERKCYLKGEAQRTGPWRHHLFFNNCLWATNSALKDTVTLLWNKSEL